jgi:hypothetical protein
MATATAHPARSASSAALALAAVAAAACGGKVESDSSAVATPPPIETLACVGGSVTFELKGAPGWWVTQSTLDDVPSDNWLSVYCECGSQIDLAPTVSTTSRDCRSCPEVWSEAVGHTSWALPPDGQTHVWDGTYYQPGTCGESLQCVTPQCAAPGHYQAQMCACAPANLAQGHCSKMSCVYVEFEYPANGPVAATLPSMP